MSLNETGPVTAIVTRTAKRDKIAEFEEWLHGFINESSRFEGHLGTNVVRPTEESKPEYIIIVRFNNLENMLKWENSDERNKWIERGSKLSEDKGKIEKMTGMEFWFTPPTIKNDKRRNALTPPPYKMAIVTIAVIFVLLTTIIPQVHRLNEGLHSLLRTLMETSIIVVLMTYVIMPSVTRVLYSWLSKRTFL